MESSSLEEHPNHILDKSHGWKMRRGGSLLTFTHSQVILGLVQLPGP